MAICSNCGHYVHEGMTQCDVCGGAVGAIASQAKKGTRDKLSWLWFLIPLITVIIYLINLATK